MKSAVIVALLGAASAQDTFRWIRDNSFENEDNWVGGAVPTGAINFDLPCMGLGGGVAIKISSSTSVGSLALANDGALVLADDIAIQLTGDTSSSGQWRCKTAEEIDTSCSRNYEILTETKDENNNTVFQFLPADHPPCYADTVQFNGDLPTSAHWRPGSFIGAIEVTGTNPVGPIQDSVSLEQWRSTVQRQFTGDSPEIGGVALLCGGPAQCSARCFDSCNAMSIEDVATNEGLFWNQSASERDAILTEGAEELQHIIELRDDVLSDLNDGSLQTDLGNTLIQLQTDFEAANSALIGEVRSADVPVVKVTTDQVVDWMTSSSIGSATTLHALRHDISVAEARSTWEWFADGQSLDVMLWDIINDKDSLTTSAASTVAVRHRRQVPIPDGASTDGQNVNDFIFMEANQLLQQYQVVSGETWTIVAAQWGGATAENMNANFATASGAFQWNGLSVAGARTYTDENGDVVPLIAPGVLEAVLSTVMAKMSLYYREQHLREIMFNIPTTTLAAAASSSDDDSSGMLMYIVIAAAAGLLLILLILFLVLRGGSNEKEPAQRGVVAFENPMYDDPAQANSGAPDSGGDGLYDDPTFDNGDKQNPAYASNDNTTDTGAGYLDVQPDDEDGDDDDDEDDDDDDDDEDDE